MKKLLALLCLVTSITCLKADNLLKNPSFEDAGASPDNAADWSRWGDWINRESEWIPTHSGKCLIGYHHWQITKPDNSGMWQEIPANVKASQKFKFSVFSFTSIRQMRPTTPLPESSFAWKPPARVSK